MFEVVCDVDFLSVLADHHIKDCMKISILL